MNEVEIEFQYPVSPMWFRTTVPVGNYAHIMHAGMIGGKPISKVRVWYSEFENIEGDTEREYLVYSFAAAGTGQNPWSAEL